MSPARLLPAVDDTVLRSLHALVGKDALDGIIDTLLATSPAICDAVDAAVSSNNGAALRQAAHQLRGATANLGATRLPTMCEQVEAYARGGDLVAAKSLAGWLRSEYQQVHDHLALVRREGFPESVSGAA